MTKRTPPYSPEVRARAVRMILLSASPAGALARAPASARLAGELGLAIEITQRVYLDAVGQRPLQESTGQLLGRGTPEHHAPAAAQARRVHRGKPIEFTRKTGRGRSAKSSGR